MMYIRIITAIALVLFMTCNCIASDSEVAHQCTLLDKDGNPITYETDPGWRIPTAYLVYANNEEEAKSRVMEGIEEDEPTARSAKCWKIGE